MKHTPHLFSRSFFLALVLCLAAASAVAQDFRVGFVNTERIFREANLAKAAQAKLEQEFSRREREIQAQGVQLRAASERFERELPTLSEAQRVARQRQLVEQDRDFQRKQREFQEDLNLRRNEELQAVLERANRVIRQIAEAEKYDLVIQEAVYIHPRHDITDKVLNSLNNAR
ncbi:OmpH family outer membrane protein [Hydrogenophaga sp.]|uniref:OmpH family outer membrane protein n=1 Tax=Hydrogenophaga sp. TaxID=1904254 RepID=UPI0019C7D518|nr:OmpH family outer membrane protein [Hydrogenophaga sp.]MBD3892751.1 OmpH family outer membrane protein [Hydrogenophaga sp.]